MWGIVMYANTLEIGHIAQTHNPQVDSAIMYRNEKPCGKAIEASGLNRSQIFFTTKIPPESMGYESTKRAIDSSLRTAAQDYFDLYESRSITDFPLTTLVS